MSTYGSSSKGSALSLGSLSNSLLVAGLIAISSMAIYYSVVAYNYQSTQDIRSYYLEQNMISNVTTVNQTFTTEITNLNQTFTTEITNLNQTFTTNITQITNQIAIIESELNITDSTGADLTNRVIDLEATRLRTINAISVNSSTQNFDIIAGAGVSVTSGAHQIILANTGVTSLSSASPSISVDQSTGAVTITDNGVASLTSASPSITVDQSTGAITITDNGVTSLTSASPSISVDQSTGSITITDNGVSFVNGMGGSIFISAKEGLTINTTGTNIEISGIDLCNAVNNLMMADANQASQISMLQNITTTNTMMIDMLKSAGMTIAEMLSGTDFDLSMFNMTLMQLMVDVDMLKQKVSDLEQNQGPNGASLPTGTIVPFGSETIPDGYLECNGTEYPTMGEYENLYMVIQTVFCGTGCATDHFAVPDLQGRVPVGLASTDTFVMLGMTTGSETHQLSLSEMPSHGHTGTVGGSGNHEHSGSTGGPSTTMEHSHLLPGHQNENAGGTSCNELTSGNVGFSDTKCGTIGAEFTSKTGATLTVGGSTGSNLLQTHGHSFSIPMSGSHTHTVSISNTGSGASHKIIQPSLVVKYMIKT